MNLVAKEFIASKPDNSGVLVLSETAGAAEELRDAIQVNPTKPGTMVAGLKEALNLPKRELHQRARAMQEHIQQFTVQKWAESFVDTLQRPLSLTPVITRTLDDDRRAELLRAYKRVSFSWLNAIWMVHAMCVIVAWWIGMWDLRTLGGWSTFSIGVMFVVAMVIYLQARLVCIDVPKEDPVDMRAFHEINGWQYITAAGVGVLLTVAVNLLYGQWANADEMIRQNFVVAPMTIVTWAALVPRRIIQWGAALALLGLWAVYFSTLQSSLH